MLRRETAPVILDDHPALGDTDQGVMGLVILSCGEKRLVGRHDRQVGLIGQIQKRCLGLAFGLHAVPLDLDVTAVRKRISQKFQPAAGQLAVAGKQRLPHRPGNTAGENNDAVGLFGKIRSGDVRPKPGLGIEEGSRAQLHEVLVAPLRAGKQNHLRQVGTLAILPGRFGKRNRELAADNRLDPRPPCLCRKFLCAEEIARVGNGERRLPIRLGEIEKLLDGQGTFQKRKSRMNAQMNEPDTGCRGSTLRHLGSMTGFRGHEASLAACGTPQRFAAASPEYQNRRQVNRVLKPLSTRGGHQPQSHHRCSRI